MSTPSPDYLTPPPFSFGGTQIPAKGRGKRPEMPRKAPRKPLRAESPLRAERKPNPNIIPAALTPSIGFLIVGERTHTMALPCEHMAVNARCHLECKEFVDAHGPAPTVSDGEPAL